MDKKNKEYGLPKENLAIFNNLDKPYSKKRVILLVAVGTEGWDCKSLTSVVLPRQETTKNFVLQTTCRCLREVMDASKENALIYLSSDNYETLDKELKENYQLSITDLSGEKEQNIRVQVRKPRLGKLKYKQIDAKYKIVKKTSPEVKKELIAFRFIDIKTRYTYDRSIISGNIGKSGLTGEVAIEDIKAGGAILFSYFSYSDFIYSLSASTYGLISENELSANYENELMDIYKSISQEMEWVLLNPHLELSDIIKIIASSFMDRIEYSKEVIEKETEIELLEWETGSEEIALYSPDGILYKFMPRISKEDARTYCRHPEDLMEDFFSNGNNIDPQDISFNYIPYKMDSEFEQNALAEMLKLAELKDIEVYFNGYKDEKLQSFWIQTPRGRYTPDFLILKRNGDKKYRCGQTVPIDKAIIIETKGKPYYNDEFRAKEKFIKEEFLRHNQHFSYHCFVDDGKNDFRKHLDTLKKLLKEF